MREFSIDISEPCNDGTYDSEVIRTELWKAETLEEAYHLAKATLTGKEWINEQSLTDLGKI